MPATYTLEDGLIRLKFVGETSLPEVGATLDRALRDPACPERPGVLSDLSESSTISTRSTEDIRVGVGMFTRHKDRLDKIALLTTPGARYAIMRMAGAFAEAANLETSVFTDEGEATRWLRPGHLDP